MQDYAVTNAMLKAWGNQHERKGKSQSIVILEHMRLGRSITSLQAARLYGICSLPKRICELRRRGYDIKKLWVKFPSGKHGMSYSLNHL